MEAFLFSLAMSHNVRRFFGVRVSVTVHEPFPKVGLISLDSSAEGRSPINSGWIRNSFRNREPSLTFFSHIEEGDEHCLIN